MENSFLIVRYLGRQHNSWFGGGNIELKQREINTMKEGCFIQTTVMSLKDLWSSQGRFSGDKDASALQTMFSRSAESGTANVCFSKSTARRRSALCLVLGVCTNDGVRTRSRTRSPHSEDKHGLSLLVLGGPWCCPHLLLSCRACVIVSNLRCFWKEGAIYILNANQ